MSSIKERVRREAAKLIPKIAVAIVGLAATLLVSGAQAQTEEVTATPFTKQPPPAWVTAESTNSVTKTPCTRPEYPREALRYELQGVVTMNFHIGIDGSVLESKVVKSSGHRILDEAALAALSKCTFKPATENGQPISVWMPVQYVWELK